MAAFFLGGGVLAGQAEGDRGIKVGDKIAQREIMTQTGEKMTIPAPEGLTVLVFWATWSPRSQPALSLWEQYQKDYREHDVRVVAVNADHQDMKATDIGKVDEYIKDNNIGLPVHIDRDLEFFNEIGVIVLPTALFFHGDGELVYKMASFPTSAALDLKEDLEKELGIAVEAKEGEAAAAVEPAYVPKNNALLYYNLGRRLHEKGMIDKALRRYILALKKDPDYSDPLRAMEGIQFADGRTPEKEVELKDLLEKNGLEMLVDRIGEGEPIVIESSRKTDPMEKMRQLMGETPSGENEDNQTKE